MQIALKLGEVHLTSITSSRFRQNRASDRSITRHRAVHRVAAATMSLPRRHRRSPASPSRRPPRRRAPDRPPRGHAKPLRCSFAPHSRCAHRYHHGRRPIVAEPCAHPGRSPPFVAPDRVVGRPLLLAQRVDPLRGLPRRSSRPRSSLGAPSAGPGSISPPPTLTAASSLSGLLAAASGAVVAAFLKPPSPSAASTSSLASDRPCR
ncbi:hypothetical protein Scep_023622 [Stephania cephalantha]|uniref:Uncharacterized protein n=1 Tax=Stephania cephalantha TaxID=152367 RepID=A0AAP0EXY6_9MAGN